MIEALEKEGIKPDLIVGSSAGSMLGALYCHFGNVKAVYDRIEEVLSSDEFQMFEKKYFGERKALDEHVERGVKHFLSSISENLKTKMHLGMAFITSAMVAEKDALALFEKIFEGITYKTLKIPFAAVSVDLLEGVAVIFTTMKTREKQTLIRPIGGPDGLMKVVMASSAIPLIFPAVAIDEHPFADGCIMANLPVREARSLYPEQDPMLVGFDVMSPVAQPEEELSSVELTLRLLDLAMRSKQKADRELVDIIFKPMDENYPWSAFSDFEKFIELGRQYMTEDRLAAFEKVVRAKCLANVKREKNITRRLVASARLERFMGKP
jgi:NTE family protein